MNASRLELGRRAQRVLRFHASPTNELQTVGAHTFGLCLILLELTGGDCSVELLKAALYHDVPEAVVGDIPSPAVRGFSALRAGRAEAEALVSEEHGMLVELTSEERRLLKLADLLELVFFALEDYSRGNRDAGAVARRALQYVVDDKLVDRRVADEAQVFKLAYEACAALPAEAVTT